MAAYREIERAPHLRKLMLATDEACQSAPRGEIEMAVQGADPDYLVNLDRLADALYFGRPHRAQFEIAFDQPPSLFTDDDGLGRRRALHALREINRVADG